MNSELKFLFVKRPDYEIAARRQYIMECLLRESDTIQDTEISTISTKDLDFLYNLYDQVFFDNQLKIPGQIVHFSLSRRMTRSAGKTIFERSAKTKSVESQVYEIRIGVDFFFHYGLTRGSKKVCGIETTSSLEALMLVFEHELCHVLERLAFGETNCRKERFKTIASSLFGHASSHHELPTHRQIAYENLNLRPGDVVCFSFEGRQLKGMIHQINKRATVMVKDKDGNYHDRKGNRYQKYYVALNQLHPARLL